MLKVPEDFATPTSESLPVPKVSEL
jgi:hypothetical protein